jgi:kynurenine formamidase
MEERRLADHLEDAPDNWGRWGDDDERGAVNHLTSEEVLRGVQSVEKGETFTLGVPLGRDEGDPVSPSRGQVGHYMKRDKGHFESGKVERPDYAGLESADDVLHMFIHGTTHVDALGHAWYDDTLYNGADATSTMGGLDHGSIVPIAEHGIVGRGVLLDLARHFDVDHLEKGRRVTLDDLLDCADAQDVKIKDRDVLVLRTGWLERFYEEGPDAIFEDFDEPGLTYSRELCDWFHETEVPLFATDTIANEQTTSETTGTRIPLHGTLLRDQGVVFNEIVFLDDLAADCATDDKYDFLYVAAPLKIVRATGSPVNPLAIK